MIKVEHIVKGFGNLSVFDDFSLEFPTGKITAILGPSGCGKTTLLNILARLVPAEQGTVIVPHQVSYLFQEPRLLPWLTIRQNMKLVLQHKMPVAEMEETVAYHIAITGLTDYADYFPGQLSGGIRQRAAMARAFSYDAPLLLMDEPFKSLDIKTRFQLMEVFLRLWQRRPRTVVMVTHDIKEAVMMGENLLVFSNKPVRLIEKLRIDVAHDQRKGNHKLIELEEGLLSLLLS